MTGIETIEYHAGCMDENEADMWAAAMDALAMYNGADDETEASACREVLRDALAKIAGNAGLTTTFTLKRTRR